MAGPSGESSGAAKTEMMHWAADHEALVDARLAGLKAGLKLTADQEKLWAPFETTAREAAKMRIEQMSAMMDRMQEMRDMMQHMRDAKDSQNMGPGKAVSPVERLEAMGRRMSERGAAVLKVADAAKPLYASLDDPQKRMFALLGAELLMMGDGRRGMGMMGGMGMGMMGDGMGAMGGSSMGMMSRETDGMGMMGGESNDDEEGSGDE
jgi:hypothetical protein